MIGYYIHHQGRGHLSRASAVAAALAEPVTALSTLPPTRSWGGPWVRLPDDADETSAGCEPTAGGRLHWVPLRSEGLRRRMSAISAWIGSARPTAIVVDVSVEVALLARLHGVPVVTMAMPGSRLDAAHETGYAVSSAIIAAWPASATSLLAGLPEAVRHRVHSVGAISRFAPVAAGFRQHNERPTVLVLSGNGGDDFGTQHVAIAARATPDWAWTHLGGASGRWVDEPWKAIVSADVVVTHGGENALAEVSAARRPAVVIPQARPHDEQHATASALLATQQPVLLRRRFSATHWPETLAESTTLDAERWSTWNDGRGAERAAQIIRECAESMPPL